jgi:ABC-type multidrug transport system ATPase subunit
LHLYTGRIDFSKLGKTRTEVMRELRDKGVGSQVLYIPVYLQPWYRRTYGYREGKCPVAEQFYEEALSLPLFPAMTVRENLEMGAFLERDKRVVSERLERAFEVFPILRERATQRAETLSGGQQQQVVLGRALMMEPRVVMIDEPSLGLAPQVAAQIFSTIASFAGMGISVLLVEQNVRRGLNAAQVGVVLDLGRKVLEGPANEILTDPRLRELYLGRQAEVAAGEDGKA